MNKPLVQALLATAVLLSPSLWAGDKPLSQSTASPSATQDDRQNPDDSGFARPYCVSQTGTHILHQDKACLDGVYGQTVTRYEWEQKGGLSTSDYLRNSVP